MKLLYYSLIIGLGIIVSVPILIILIGYEQALETKDKIITYFNPEI